MIVKRFFKTDARGQGVIELILIFGVIVFSAIIMFGVYSSITSAGGSKLDRASTTVSDKMSSAMQNAMKGAGLGNGNGLGKSKFKKGMFYAVSSGKLISIKPETAAVETVLTLSGVACGSTALAFSPNGKKLYSYCNKYNQLMEINMETGERTLIGSPTEYQWINGLAFVGEAKLYGLHGPTESFVRIDLETGAIEVIADLGDIRNNGLAVNFATGELYAVSGRGKNPDVILKIDIDTGATTEVGSFGVTWGKVGAEFHPVTGELYAVRSGNILKKINLDTGEVTEIGILGNDARTVSLASPW